MSVAPRVHFHTWAVVEPSRYSAHGDQLNMEACADCPTWRLLVRAAHGRYLVEARVVADAVIEAFDRLGAVAEPNMTGTARTVAEWLRLLAANDSRLVTDIEGERREAVFKALREFRRRPPPDELTAAALYLEGLAELADELNRPPSSTRPPLPDRD